MAVSVTVLVGRGEGLSVTVSVAVGVFEGSGCASPSPVSSHTSPASTTNAARTAATIHPADDLFSTTGSISAHSRYTTEPRGTQVPGIGL